MDNTEGSVMKNVPYNFWLYLHKIWVISVHYDGELVIVRVPEDKFKEFGGSHGGVNGVFCGDGLTQHGHDAFFLCLFAVQVNGFQISGSLLFLKPV